MTRFFTKGPILSVGLVYVLVSLIVYAPLGLYLPLSGDEHYYYGASFALVDVVNLLLNGDFAALPAQWDKVIAKGFFIPSTSLLMLPVYLISTKVWIVRLWFFLLNSTLILVVLRRSDQLFGRNTTLLFMLVLLLNPMINLFAFTFWGEGLIGRMLVLLVLELYYFYQRPDTSWKKVIIFTTILLVMLVLRHSFAVIIPFVLLVYVYSLRHVLPAKTGVVLRNITVPILVILVFIVVWSVPLSKKTGVYYPLTTSTALNTVILFEDDEFKTRFPTGSGEWKTNIWDAADDYYTYLSEETEVPFAVLVEQQRKKTLHDLDWLLFHTAVGQNIRDFIATPNLFIDRYFEFSGRSELHSFLSFLNATMWTLLVATFLGALLTSFKDIEHRFLSVISVILLLLLSLQVWMFIAHARHTFGLLPLLSLLFAVHAVRWRGLKMMFNGSVIRQSMLFFSLKTGALVYVVAILLIAITG